MVDKTEVYDDDVTYTTLTKENDRAFSEWALSPDLDVEMKKHSFMGEQLNHEGKWEKKAKPLMNIEGIQKFSEILREGNNVNTKFSKFSEQRIKFICQEYSQNIVNTLYMQGNEFDIDFKEYSGIVISLDENHEKAFMRALEGIERDKHLGTHQVIEKRGFGDQKEKEKTQIFK